MPAVIILALWQTAQLSDRMGRIFFSKNSSCCGDCAGRRPASNKSTSAVDGFTGALFEFSSGRTPPSRYSIQHNNAVANTAYKRMVENGFSKKLAMEGTGAKAGLSQAWAITNRQRRTGSTRGYFPHPETEGWGANACLQALRPGSATQDNEMQPSVQRLPSHES